MLTKNQEKLIRVLQTKKGRKEHGLTIVEGQKNIEMAGDLIDFRFTPADVVHFGSLVTTETPQDVAAVVRIPVWTMEEVTKSNIVVVLDGVQDPGNVGAMLRLCLAFEASVIAIDSADISSPKVVRSSGGALFAVPWITQKREQGEDALQALGRPVYRLEKRDHSTPMGAIALERPCVVIVGSEGSGIHIQTPGTSLVIPHSDKLESLNVAQALTICLWQLRAS